MTSLLFPMVLFINTALRIHEIILLGSRKEVLFERSFVGGKDSEKPFYEAMVELKEKFGVNFPKLDHLVVLTGPGSFTALRMGICAVNMMAFLLEKEVMGVKTTDFEQYSFGEPTDIILPAGGVFVHLFKGETHEIINFEELDKSKKYGGELPERFKEYESKLILPRKSSVEILNKINLDNFPKSKFVSPWYGKEVV